MMIYLFVSSKGYCLLITNIVGLVFLGSFLGSLVSPAVIKKIGNRASLGLATILYTGQFLGVILLQAWAIFLGSCVSGKNIIVLNFIISFKN